MVMTSFQTVLSKTSNQKEVGYILVLLYLFMEYGTPQGLIPALRYLKLGKILIGLLVVYLLISNNIRFDSIVSKCILIFLFLSGLHIIIATNTFLAFHGAKGFFMNVIVFLSISAFMDSFRKLERFFNIWILINFICALVGLRYRGSVPFSGFMGDENDFALVMNMAFPLAYFMFLETKSTKMRFSYFCALCTFISANVSSLSRGGFIGLIPVTLYCWYKTPKKILSTIIIVIMVGVLSFVAPDKYWDEVRSIKEENVESGTGEARWYYWKIAWKLFLDNPIIGVGPMNIIYRIGEYQPKEDLRKRHSLSGTAAHSLYVELMGDFGLTGILLFFTMLYFFSNNARQILKKEKEFQLYLKNKNRNKKLINDISFNIKLQKLKSFILGLNGALIGYLISGLFISVFYYPHFWILIAVNNSVKNIAIKLYNK